MLNNLTFGNSKNYFAYFNTLLYNTHNIKDFIFFTTSFKYSFVILPLCLFLSLPSPPPSLSSLKQKQPTNPHIILLNPANPTSLFSTLQSHTHYQSPDKKKKEENTNHPTQNHGFQIWTV